MKVSAGPLSVVQYLSVVLVPFKLLELAAWLIQWTVDSTFLGQQVVMEERMKASEERIRVAGGENQNSFNLIVPTT